MQRPENDRLSGGEDGASVTGNCKEGEIALSPVRISQEKNSCAEPLAKKKGGKEEEKFPERETVPE